MRTLIRTTILPLIVILASCATQAQREAEKITAQATELNGKVEACTVDARGHQDVAALVGKIPWSGKATFDQLADESYLTKSETTAIGRYHTLIQPCRSMWLDGYQAIAPAMVPTIATLLTETDIVYVKMVQRKTTWGDANQAFAQISNQSRAEFQRIEREMNRDLAASHESEMASRRASAAALRAYRPITCRTTAGTTVCF